MADERDRFAQHRRSSIIIYLVIIAGTLCASYGIFLLDDPIAAWLTQEDGPLENATAAAFLVASGLAALLYLRSISGNDLLLLKTRKNVFFLLLALAFFFGAGEELSWGQRIVGFESPELFKERNIQKELNFHNLMLFDRRGDSGQSGSAKSGLEALIDIERLFSLFWLTYCFLVPIADRLLSAASRLFARIGLPVPPLWLGVFFPLNYVLSKLLVGWSELEVFTPHVPILEVKEFVFGVYFAVLMIYFALGVTRDAREAAQA
jgi:hypothetical protein